MRVNGKKLIQRLEALYPPHLAESWDNVGLQVGNENRVVERILICLEVNERVLDEAIAKNCDMIIAHHPLIFKGVKSLSEATPQGRLLSRLIRENLLVYIMHTNYDTAPGGLNDILAQRLELERTMPLNTTQVEKLFKLAVYVPESALEALSEALYANGAGRMGAYDSCGFTVAGSGSFRPLEGAQPAIGQVGQFTTTPEVKLETVVAEGRVGAVLEALKRTHPYETPAYDLFELKTPATAYGLGRVGHLKTPLSTEDFVARLKEAFGISALRLVNPPAAGKKIAKVALVSGAGMDYVRDAATKGADVFVTGDIKYHEATVAADYGLMLADVGHFESEVVYKHHLKTLLEAIVTDQEYDLVVTVSEAEGPVFVFA